MMKLMQTVNVVYVLFAVTACAVPPDGSGVTPVLQASTPPASPDRGYRPHSLEVCQSHATSTMANAACFEREIDKLKRRVPASAVTQARHECEIELAAEEREQGPGTWEVAASEDCNLTKLAARLHPH